MLPKSSLHKLRRKLNKKEIKDHFQRNKTRYLVGGAFVVGVAVGFAIYHYKVTPVKINGKGSDKIFGQTYRIVGLGTCSV